MRWHSVGDFFSMGGYALYVWGSFGVTAVVVVIEMLLIRSQRRELLRDLRNELMSERTSP